MQMEKEAVEAVKENKMMTALNLKGNYIGHKIIKLAEEIKDNTTIKAEDIEVIANAIKYNTTLTKLNLSNVDAHIGSNEIVFDGAMIIANLIKVNVTLNTLILSNSLNILGNNSLGTKGAQAIADSLKDNTILISLSLSSSANCM
eukprot:TRINITY_DN19581_c0_g1_i1.p1 TRINITY_DN19581_c0_g1~~TRINITY_DN19581_c0_g1_i1.p1  ORF type:complete len:145 (-),score=22.43 TRINITY_DN19581_c0_g1_i1:235-669(-)